MQIKLLSEKAVAPFKARRTDAGYDLTSVQSVWIDPQQMYKVKTDVAVMIPEGYVGLIRDRSGLGSKGISVTAGVVDHGYTGEVVVCLTNHSSDPYYIKEGDRIAQLVVLPCYCEDIEVVEDLGAAKRGEKGFGSSGL